MKKDKGVMGEILGMMIKRGLKGEDPTKVPMPVRIFEPMSLLQRISTWYGFAPKFLRAATLMQDPFEKFKNVMAFALSGLFWMVN